MTTKSERRANERSDCAIPARIKLSDRLSIAVTLLDLSTSGVRIQVAETIDLPDEFELLVTVIETVEMRHRVRVAWREGDELGGEFLALTGPATDAIHAMDAAIEAHRSTRKR